LSDDRRKGSSELVPDLVCTREKFTFECGTATFMDGFTVPQLEVIAAEKGKDHRIRLTDGEIRILVKALNASMPVFGSSMENPQLWKAMTLVRRLKKLLEGSYGKRLTR